MENSEVIHNPYVGPRTFAQTDANRFFGREREARELQYTLTISEIVLFYAQSGAGKSSLINTRLIPSLRTDEYEILPIGRVGGEVPARNRDIENIYVYSLIMSIGGDDENPERFATMSLAHFLNQLTIVDSDQQPETGDVPHRLLVIDQFEEILTTHPERWMERDSFFRQLGQALTDDPYLHVLLAMREEYIAALDPYAHLVPGRLRTRFYMESMGAEAALEAIRQPAVLGGRPFAPGVAEKLVDDLRQIRVVGQSSAILGQFVEPVQLQVVCFQLWDNLNDQPPGPITGVDVAGVGDVDNALIRFYEDSLHAILSDSGIGEVSERQLRLWFDQMLITEVGTRNLVIQGEQETAGLPNTVVRMLQLYFLVRAEIRSGNIWIELVHDRLVDPIRTSNRRWFLQNTNALQRQVELWEQASRPDGLLLDHEALMQAEHWAATDWNKMSEAELEFLNRSQAQDMRVHAEREQKRRLRILAAFAAAISLISVGVAAWSLLVC